MGQAGKARARPGRRLVRLEYRGPGRAGPTAREIGISREGSSFGPCFINLTDRAGRGRPGPTRESWPHLQRPLDLKCWILQF